MTSVNFPTHQSCSWLHLSQVCPGRLQMLA